MTRFCPVHPGFIPGMVSVSIVSLSVTVGDKSVVANRTDSRRSAGDTLCLQHRYQNVTQSRAHPSGFRRRPSALRPVPAGSRSSARTHTEVTGSVRRRSRTTGDGDLRWFSRRRHGVRWASTARTRRSDSCRDGSAARSCAPRGTRGSVPRCPVEGLEPVHANVRRRRTAPPTGPTRPNERSARVMSTGTFIRGPGQTTGMERSPVVRV